MTQIRIDGVEFITTKTNKPMARILSSEGKLSTFDIELAAQLQKTAVGKMVEAEFKQSGAFKNLVSVQQILGNAPDEPISKHDREMLIIRQSCLKAAIEMFGYLSEEGKSNTNVLSLAEAYEAWVNR